MKFVISLLLAACCLNIAYSAVFGPNGQWLRNPARVASDETDNTTKQSKFASFLQLRGGEAAKKTTDKITGCCIGIDLGTTYRYIQACYEKANTTAILSPSLFLSPSVLTCILPMFSSHLIAVVLLCGRTVELKSVLTNKETE